MSAALPPALILAGGRSSRMGRNKALELLGQTTIIAHIIARLMPQVGSIAINAPPGWAEHFGLPVVPDSMTGQAGPLAGIAAGLRHCRSTHRDASHMLSLPADSPFFPADLVSRLQTAIASPQTIAIATSNETVHPVVGLWPIALLDDLETWLTEPENRRVRSFLARHDTREITFPMIETLRAPIDPFFNINTPDDLAEARQLLEILPP